MSIFYLLIGISILIAIVFLLGFLWSIRSGQYDDTYTPAVRMLFEPKETQINLCETADEDNDAASQ